MRPKEGADARSAQHTRNRVRSTLPAPVWAGLQQGSVHPSPARSVSREQEKSFAFPARGHRRAEVSVEKEKEQRDDG